MPKTRIKTVIIVLLIVVNVAFLGITLRDRAESSQLARAAEEDLRGVLAQMNLTLPETITIPTTTSTGLDANTALVLLAGHLQNHATPATVQAVQLTSTDTWQINTTIGNFQVNRASGEVT